jgi:hypothetical protein
MNNLSFFQTSAPDFDEDVKVQIPASNVIPIIANPNQAQNKESNTNASSSKPKPKVEYASNIQKKVSNPKKPDIPFISNKSLSDNKTSFIKPSDSDKNYETVYEYGKERTYEIVEDEKPIYEVMENEIPWSAYVTRY